MNKTDAREIADTITREQLRQMFDTAKEKITDWDKPSDVNKLMSKGYSWNVLYPAVKFENLHVLEIKNMVWEFGDFLPDELKIKKKKKKKVGITMRQDPIF